MLLNLHVKNLALIKEIDIAFGQGLNVITGETGAGKSLLLGSVNLALGGKFSQEMLRKGEENALVELVFDVEDEKTLNELENMGYPAEDGLLIITRKIISGRASSKVNGETCTASTLKKISEKLINIHGQRDNQTLLKAESQLSLLDTYGNKRLNALLSAVSEAYRGYKSAEKSMEMYVMDEEKRLRELSMLEYEIQEIEEADISEGEEEELDRQFRKMVNSRNIVEALGKVYESTGYDSGAGELIGHAVREIGFVADFDEELRNIANSLDDVEAILSDINRQASSYLNEFSYSDRELSDIEGRLDKIHTIQSKYGSTVEKINEYLNNSQERLEFLNNYEKEKQKAQKALDEATKQLEKRCEALSSERKKCAEDFADELAAQLEELNFAQAVIDIGFSRAGSYRSNGFDDIEILISTNPGEPVKPLVKVASGGELSRIMLALKNMIADEENTETLIFDEIDTGISGRTAQRVSEKMASIADGHQILCVTHLAQIAAMADKHFIIEKNADENETITTLKELDPKEDIEELARILGGSKITEAVVANAREMKELAEEYKKKHRGS